MSTPQNKFIAIQNMRILKPAPYPLDCPIMFNMDNWKYDRKGIITNKYNAFFFVSEKGDQYEITPHKINRITIIETNENWSMYQ